MQLRLPDARIRSSSYRMNNKSFDIFKLHGKHLPKYRGAEHETDKSGS